MITTVCAGKTVSKTNRIVGVLTNTQVNLIHKQMEKLVSCEGGDIEKSWDQQTIVLKVEHGIPWKSWCVDCLAKAQLLEQRIKRFTAQNEKSSVKQLAKFTFRMEIPVE